MLVFDEQLALATLEAARERGYRVAIDDFGTGYSSLAYLRSLGCDRAQGFYFAAPAAAPPTALASLVAA